LAKIANEFEEKDGQEGGIDEVANLTKNASAMKQQ